MSSDTDESEIPSAKGPKFLLRIGNPSALDVAFGKTTYAPADAGSDEDLEFISPVNSQLIDIVHPEETEILSNDSSASPSSETSVTRESPAIASRVCVQCRPDDTSSVRLEEDLVKGRILVSVMSVSQKERILAETPSVVVPNIGIEEEAETIYRSLTEDQRRLVDSFTATVRSSGSLVSRAFSTNVIPLSNLGNDNAVQSGLFELVSRVSHACNPNIGWRWNQEEGQIGMSSLRILTLCLSCGLELYAWKDIRADEELSFTYLTSQETSMTGSERRALLRRRFGFVCGCAVCAMPEEEDGAAQWRAGEKKRDEALKVYRGIRSCFERMLRGKGKSPKIRKMGDTAFADIRKGLAILQAQGLECECETLLLAQWTLCLYWAQKEEALEAGKKYSSFYGLMYGEEAIGGQAWSSYLLAPETFPQWGLFRED